MGQQTATQNTAVKRHFLKRMLINGVLDLYMRSSLRHFEGIY
ncbi:hypothetical protein BTN50_1615 (plasmid) [Candidatus Enterovibrio altilux]|uniref:Uncharacterized protein n=1 Tax=Candidatus Enterovibrio altilux TaxID=1927128 RepID=A0A291BAM2_9GAMM|nr:hypothetical protein BTN50_1615 [Candidatus Enterovibrio luxaltus]